MDYEITILRKDQYGRPVYYPVCDKAKMFANIAGTKTITSETVRHIKVLGYKINIQHEKDEI
jgi:capsid protein